MYAFFRPYLSRSAPVQPFDRFLLGLSIFWITCGLIYQEETPWAMAVMALSISAMSLDTSSYRGVLGALQKATWIALGVCILSMIGPKENMVRASVLGAVISLSFILLTGTLRVIESRKVVNTLKNVDQEQAPK
ncbi:hypothetical protein ACYPKM_00095 [Pseudomonas aeruginosa]